MPAYADAAPQGATEAAKASNPFFAPSPLPLHYPQFDKIKVAFAADPSLPEVGWSWLADALAERSATHVAAGGTVTQTTSRRFGDIADVERITRSLELRASWTALDSDLRSHLLAFADLLCQAAGLPPEGVATLDRR